MNEKLLHFLLKAMRGCVESVERDPDVASKSTEKKRSIPLVEEVETCEIKKTFGKRR